MKEIIIITGLLFCCFNLHANEPITIKDKKTERSSSYSNSSIQAPFKTIYQEQGFYIDVSPGISAIKNSNLQSEIWKSEINFGYNFNVGLFRSFSSWVKVKLGVGFSSFSTNLTGDGEIQSPQFEDIDNDIYFETLTLSNAEYNINPMYLTVPLVLELGNPNINKIGYYVDFGIEYAYLINENNSTSGSYTTKGTYPKWGVTIENVPELGFYSARNLNSEWSIQKNNYSVKGGAGITIPLSGIVIFKIGVTGYLGLKDISNKQTQNPESSPLTQQAYEFRSSYINNPLTYSEDSQTLYTGIEFGFYISNRVK